MKFKPIDPDLISRGVAAGLAGWSSDKLTYEGNEGRAPLPYRYNARCLLYSRREIEQFVADRDAAVAAEDEANAAAKATRAEKRKAAVAADLRKTA
ncbi:hypothetical protein SAE02_71990 [Skermanella aerolata]|uniref:Uncharacterized protein n=1 Tax=Skermanella aerolata TaxID=393310 RepID=A0A512E2U8_9PROT|nr:hypothetical protein [Skermanella aerolata]KJB90126.1 hypothetical protein N826_06150 [Skermanella aerolata KACC 11604]GEO43051.1 hypothetical protein SAE02_71990 [Skermanella aerolata]